MKTFETIPTEQLKKDYEILQVLQNTLAELEERYYDYNIAKIQEKILTELGKRSLKEK